MRFRQVGFLAAGILAGSVVLVGCSDGDASSTDPADSSSASSFDKQCAGDWKSSVFTMEGETVTADDFDEELEQLAAASGDSSENVDVSFEDMFTLEMKDNNEYRLYFLMGDEEMKGMWEGVEGGCKINLNDETVMMPIEDGVMTLDLDDDNSVGFVKQ